MENLHNALSKILATVTQVAKSYMDGKIVWKEWLQIGATVLGWVWIFKHLKEIKADLDVATEETMKSLVEAVKVEFDIPQDQLEETIEQSLSVILLIFAMIGKKVPQLKIGK